MDGSSHSPTISIIVVSFNTREMTLACLGSIVKQGGAHTYEVIVVDNASTDGSAAAIQAAYGDDARFQLNLGSDNLGFAAANNLAVKDARGTFVLLLNPDTVVLDHALDQLVDFALERPKNKIWGGRTVFGDGSLNPTSCWGRMTLWSVFSRQSGLRNLLAGSRLFDARAMASWKRDSVREVAIVTGCLFLIERSFWNELNGFDPAFFMYGEESDLCIRATALGARPIITPDATIVHYGAASDTVKEDKHVRLFSAELMLYARHFSRLSSSTARWLMLAGTWGRAMSMRLLGRRESAWIGIWNRRKEWS